MDVEGMEQKCFYFLFLSLMILILVPPLPATRGIIKRLQISVGLPTEIEAERP